MNSAGGGSFLRAVTLACALLPAACGTRDAGLDDNEKIVRATLALLASGGAPICVDDHTRGLPLPIFNTMLAAPPATRAMLRWRPPGPLRPPQAPRNWQIAKTTAAGTTLRLPEPRSDQGALPPLDQIRFNSAARALAPIRALASVRILPGLTPSGVTARWWPLNRFAADCDPIFELSDPVGTRDLAFITVTAGHWGATYALERAGADWRPAAEWSNWLY